MLSFFCPLALLLLATARLLRVFILTSPARLGRCAAYPHAPSLRRQYALRAIPVGGYVSFPNNYEVDEDGVVTELDDPDLLYNR